MADMSSGKLSPTTHVQLATGWGKRFIAQFWVLFWYKALGVAKRNLISTLLRVVASPFLFILLTFVVVKGIEHSPQQRKAGDTVTSRAAVSVTPIPSCETDSYYRAGLTCWDFAFTPNNSDAVQGIVDAIRSNNPGRPIPADKVISFSNRQDSNAFVLADLDRRIQGAYHFNVSGATISYTLQTNSTVRTFKGLFQDPNFFSAMPLQVAVEREIARYNFQQAGKTLDAGDWEVELAGYPHPSLTTQSLTGQILGPFLFAANMFGFIILISQIVGERELKLRQAMRTMGLLDSAYWTSWACYEVVMAVITSLLICAFGSAFQFNLFYTNGFELALLTFFLFQLAMSSFALMMSVFVKKSASAVNLGFVIFIVGWIMQIINEFGFPYSPSYVGSDKWAIVVFSLFPWSLLVKAVQDLGNAVIPGNPGIQWSDRSTYCQNLGQAQIAQQPATPGQYRDYQCILSVNQAFIFLTIEWIVYLLLAVYLDNIVPNENGTRRPFFYPLLPNYWAPSRRRNIRHRPGAVNTAAGPQFLKKPVEHDQLPQNLDEDVAAEKARVEELLQHRIGMAGALAAEAHGIDANAVEIFGLQKVFPGTSRARNLLCFGRGKKPDFWAIKDSWLAIPKGQLFCLLGPNGAGKTTTFNILTGIVPPTGGDALIYGEALSSPGGIDRIRRRMGVCPQFDILWNELSGLEHLLIYGNIKGLPRKAVEKQADELLCRVRLTEAAKIRTGSYSGGMKRRLSVAIALLGDPQIVFLDEPTTGMDPISRRHVWDIIQQEKQGRAIVLTTHSMEEADVLGDRIAIMARGTVRCIGTSLRLKQRFGAGYQLSLSTLQAGRFPLKQDTLAAQRAQAKELVRARLGLLPSDETSAYIQYRVPREQEAALPLLLASLEADKARLGFSDVHISLTSLEEVFLTIARQAEQEAAVASGRTTRKVFVADGTEIKVGLGEEYATHNGKRYHVRWAQDDSGALQILEAVAVAEE